MAAASGIAIGDNLVLNFNESVKAGSGNLSLLDQITGVSETRAGAAKTGAYPGGEGAQGTGGG